MVLFGRAISSPFCLAIDSRPAWVILAFITFKS